jgi:hypothetical protein
LTISETYEQAFHRLGLAFLPIPFLQQKVTPIIQ